MITTPKLLELLQDFPLEEVLKDPFAAQHHQRLSMTLGTIKHLYPGCTVGTLTLGTHNTHYRNVTNTPIDDLIQIYGLQATILSVLQAQDLKRALS